MPTASQVVVEITARTSKAREEIRKYKTESEAAFDAVAKAAERSGIRQERAAERAAKAREEIRKYKTESEAAFSGAARSAERSARTQQREIERTSRSIRANSTAIQSSLRAIGAGIATYLGGRELIEFADSFTRIQNNLRQAGLEGAQLARVQENLLNLSKQYGVSLESLSGVFLKASLSQRELGATTADIIKLNEVVAASLRITGTTTEAARGALLQLGQALGSAKVRAEEFNSIQEGAFPLLQAAARGIERFDGSVTQLRNAVLKGTVTNREFFEGILKGGTQTIEDAQRSVLTLAGGWQALTSSLTVYFGEADKANGISSALGETMGFIAKNLDTLIPAIAAVAVGIGINMTASAVAGTAAFTGLRAVIAGTITVNQAFAASAVAVRAALGPISVVLGVVAAAFIYMNEQAEDATVANARVRASMDAVASRTSDVDDAISRLANSYGKARVEALKLVDAQRQIATTEVVNAQSALRQAQRDRGALEGRVGTAQTGGRGGGLVNVALNKQIEKARRDEFTAGQNVINALSNLTRIEEALRNPPSAGAPPSAADDGKKKKKGRTPEEIQAQFDSELRSLQISQLQAQKQISDDIDERADIDREILNIERDGILADIKANKDFTAQQKQQLSEIVTELYGQNAALDEQGNIIVDGKQSLLAINIERERQRELARMENELAQARVDADITLLDLQIEGVSNVKDRLALEKRINELRFEAERQAILDSDLSEEIKAARLRQLDAERAIADRRAEQANETPFERRARETRDIAANINSEFEAIQVDGLDNLNDGLTQAITGAKSFGSVFRDVANQIVADLIRIAIRLTVISALEKALGVGLSGGTPPGFASGGSFTVGGGSTPGLASGGSFSVAGNPGTDRNTLSLNGRPVARVSMGETVSVKPASRGSSGGSGPSIYVDARGAVMNDEFARQILARAKVMDEQTGAAVYQRAVSAAPSAVQSKQRYG